MHSVPRSPEPDYWEQLKAEHQRWEDLRSQERVLIRDSLVEDFGPICAYCECPCGPPTPTHDNPDEETIDHFRPRARFSHLSFDWLNLVYCCYRCNQRKDSQWPGYDDESVNLTLVGSYPGWYAPPQDYVNPNWAVGEKHVREYFAFNVTTGEMTPAEELDAFEWSMAFRTIRDIDLNDYSDKSPGENSPTHLWNRRRNHLNFLASQLNQIDDISAQISIVRQFTMPDKPYSSFIAAWVDERFGPMPQ